MIEVVPRLATRQVVVVLPLVALRLPVLAMVVWLARWLQLCRRGRRRLAGVVSVSLLTS